MLTKSQKQRIFFLILFVIPLAGAGVDIHVPSLPSIMTFFHATSLDVKNSVTYYLLGYGIGQLVVGSISDSIGRKSFLLLGSLVYALACLSSIFMHTVTYFLVSRFIQGIAVAGPGIAIKACISDVFQDKELEKVSTYATVAWAGGPILAPFIGGYLQYYISWKACFIFLSCYALLIAIVTACIFSETKVKKEPLHLLAIAKNYGRVLTHSVFLGGTVVAGVVYAIMAVFNVMGPFIIQASLHYNAIDFGHVALSLGLAWFFGGMLNRFFLVYASTQKIFVVGLVIWCVFQIIFMFSLPELPFILTTVLIPILLIYVLGGMINPSVFAIVLGQFPELGGTVNAISGVSMMIVASLVTSIASQFNTESQISLITIYTAMSLVCVLAYFLLIRPKAKKQD